MSHLFIFAFISVALGDLRKYCYGLCQRMVYQSSLLGILWCHLMFKSLSPFEFIFVYGVKMCFNLTCMWLAVQLFQHNLLKRLPFFVHSCFVKGELTPHKGVWLYFWALYFAALIPTSILCRYHIVLVTVAPQCCRRSGRIMPSVLFSFLRTALTILALLWFCIKFQDYLF